MTGETFITDAFLVVSVFALIVQTRALLVICRSTQRRPGLARTSACRVAASAVYVLVGLNARTTQYAVLYVAFAAFTGTQLIWWVNSRLDVRLARPRPARRPWRIQIIITRPPK